MELTISHKQKISLALKGRFMAELHPRFKGEQVSYSGLHKRFVRHFGNAKDHPCSECGKKLGEVKKLTWANLSGKYLWDKKDWIVLCVSCHTLWDNACPVFKLGFI